MPLWRVVRTQIDRYEVDAATREEAESPKAIVRRPAGRSVEFHAIQITEDEREAIRKAEPQYDTPQDPNYREPRCICPKDHAGVILRIAARCRAQHE